MGGDPAQDATDALIAKLMAQQESAYGGYYDDDECYESDDSDTAKKRRKKPNGSSARKGSASNQASVAACNGKENIEQNMNTDDLADGDEITETGRRRRKDVGKQREKGRPWTDEEERLFGAALELHGRDWKKGAEHVKTRDHRAMASHAQKYLIKMCLAGKPLPAKMSDSGAGYTLSGKLLDPTSAAAKAYGFKPELLAKLTAEELQVAKSGLLLANLPARYGGELEDGQEPVLVKETKLKGPKPSNNKQVARKRKKSTGGSGSEAEEEEAPAAVAEGPAPAPAPAAPAPVVVQRTEYAQNRPKRELAGQRVALGETSESTQLIKMSEFIGHPASGAPLAQPFHVKVAAQALLLGDFHAHMSSNEVIGLLGGTWDLVQRQMVVEEAYPCRRAAGSDARTSVELDPEAEVEVRSLMEHRSQRCVGWYHSHPVFEPSPSQKDMDNQRNYQALFRDADTKVEPFVGFIFGPYDTAMIAPLSAVTAFVVQQRNNNLTPFAVRYTTQGVDRTPDEVHVSKLMGVLDMFKEDRARINLAEQWRPFTLLKEGMPDGPAVSKIQKLHTSLKQFMREAEPSKVEALLAMISHEVQARWAVSLAPAADAQDAQKQADEQVGATQDAGAAEAVQPVKEEEMAEAPQVKEEGLTGVDGGAVEQEAGAGKQQCGEAPYAAAPPARQQDGVQPEAADAHAVGAQAGSCTAATVAQA
mmetsp:Transcript_8971/g.19194  ORF Transcript_8971/g.19194 Transcript_8971/m.19194 type:complete len:703 (-) Transcript_8971:278-2386(-)